MKLPDPLTRRHLLDGALEPSKAWAIASLYLDDGREVEAIDFLAVAHVASNGDAHAALVRLQAEAMERGDAFLMQMASHALKEVPAGEDWQRLADAATRAGRAKDAETALRLATLGD